jgi:cardiolipin synthase (CMP-forming)
MWVAHLLTLSRIPLALVFWIAVSDPRWAFAVMALAALTDIVDGAVARRARRVAEARGLRPPPGPGAWLDPVCDKFFVLSVLVATYAELAPSPYLLMAIATRELILIPLAALYRLTPLFRARMRYDFRAGPLGRAATIAQFLAIAALLLRHPSQVPLAAVAAAVGLLAAIHYIRRGVRLARTTQA